MKIKRNTIIVLGVALLGLAFLVIGVTLQKEPVIYYAHSLRNYQEADATAGYPIEIAPGEFRTGEFIPKLNLLTGIERYRLPVANGFEEPSLQGSVRAVANGLVLMTGRRVVLGHRLPDGRIVQSVYSGLKKVEVHVGSLVPRGDALGLAGPKSDFEIYESDGIDVELPNHPNRISLNDLVATYPARADIASPLAIMRDQERQLSQALEKIQLDSKSAEKLSEILSRDR